MSAAVIHAQQPILDAIEKVYSGQWYCRKAEQTTHLFWTFVFVDSGTEAETVIEGVRADKAVPVLRDMLANAEVTAGDEESS